MWTLYLILLFANVFMDLTNIAVQCKNMHLNRSQNFTFLKEKHLVEMFRCGLNSKST